MKRTILILVTVLVALAVGCSKKTKDYVLTGQLYYTPSPGYIEKVYGKVKEIKITNYLAKEENGKFVKGNEFTAEDRKNFNNMEPTFMEEYSPTGIILKSISYDQNGKVTSYCSAETAGNKIDKLTYYAADTAAAYGKTTYNENFLEEVKYFNPKNDTLYMSVKYEYNQNGNRTKLQIHDYKGEPGSYTSYTYNDKGLIVQCKQFDKSGKPTFQSEITHGDKGDRLTTDIETFGANSRLIKYAFKSEYDKMGNWVKALMYVDNKPLIIRERQIEYYE
jgi:hypothetical protein